MKPASAALPPLKDPISMKPYYSYLPFSILVKKGSFLFLSIVLLVGCRAYKNSYAVKGEEVELILLKAEDSLVTEENQGLMTPIFGLLIPQVIKWGVSGTKTLIHKEAQKYTASYAESRSGNDFYIPGSGENILLPKYRGFELRRYARISHKEENTTTSELASNFIFHFDLNPEKTFMSLNPTEVAVYFAKAKLNQGDENLDVLLTVRLVSTWVDAGQSFNKKEIASFEYRFSNMEIGNPYDENSPMLAKHQNNWFPLLPVSVDRHNKVRDYGYFDIHVTVVETDDFGKRLEKYSTTISTNSDLIEALLNRLVE